MNSIDPVAFTILGKPIYWYGVMFALSFVVCATHWNMLGKREGRPAHFGSVSAIATLVYARRLHEAPASLVDFGITAIPLGHAFGRVGCFMNGCCYGVPWNGPWAIYTAGAMRMPVQLYESAFNVLLYLALLW